MQLLVCMRAATLSLSLPEEAKKPSRRVFPLVVEGAGII